MRQSGIGSPLPQATADRIILRKGPCPSKGPRMPQLPEAVDVTEPAVLIRISQLFDTTMTAEALYEATRGVWKVGQRREAARYALAVAEGVVREVYEIDRWQPAGSTAYATRDATQVQIEGRWEFTGRVAPKPLRDKYVDGSVAHYFSQGAVNPVLYVNC